MTSYNSTQARKNFFGLLTHVVDTHDVITITSKHGNAVLLSEEDWENISETVTLSMIPGLKKSILRARKEPLKESSEQPGW